MALPKIAQQKFKTKIPSTKQNITFRAFLMKEQKILLQASEGGTEAEMYSAMITILESCISEEVDYQKLPMSDLEYLLLQLRIKSVGEEITVPIEHKTGDCKEMRHITLNLNDVKVISHKDHTNLLELKDDISIKMKYPAVDAIDTLKGLSDSDAAFGMITMCLDMVIQGDEVYEVKEFTDKEVGEFIDSLPGSEFEKIENFFRTSPSLKHTIKWKCNKCGKQEIRELEGLANFS